MQVDHVFILSVLGVFNIKSTSPNFNPISLRWSLRAAFKRWHVVIRLFTIQSVHCRETRFKAHKQGQIIPENVVNTRKFSEVKRAYSFCNDAFQS